MNQALIIDIDHSRDKNQKIIIQHVARGAEGDISINPTEEYKGPVWDMATLCEGIVCLIHAADEHGVKKSADSLRDCIKHLEAGFADATYFATTFTSDEDEG